MFDAVFYSNSNILKSNKSTWNKNLKFYEKIANMQYS